MKKNKQQKKYKQSKLVKKNILKELKENLVKTLETLYPSIDWHTVFGNYYYLYFSLLMCG